MKLSYELLVTLVALTVALAHAQLSLYETQTERRNFLEDMEDELLSGNLDLPDDEGKALVETGGLVSRANCWECKTGFALISGERCYDCEIAFQASMQRHSGAGSHGSPGVAGMAGIPHVPQATFPQHGEFSNRLGGAAPALTLPENISPIEREKRKKAFYTGQCHYTQSDWLRRQGTAEKAELRCRRTAEKAGLCDNHNFCLFDQSPKCIFKLLPNRSRCDKHSKNGIPLSDVEREYLARLPTCPGVKKNGEDCNCIVDEYLNFCGNHRRTNNNAREMKR